MLVFYLSQAFGGPEHANAEPVRASKMTAIMRHYRTATSGNRQFQNHVSAWFGLTVGPGPAALRPLFIPRRVIHSGNRDFVQAEIDAQDRTVVDQVVKDESPHHGRSRHG